MVSMDLGAIARRTALADLYQKYADCLDEFRLHLWPDLFTRDGVYRAQGRENRDRGLPLAAMWCEGRGMFDDRVTVISRIMVYAPRLMRHVVSPPLVSEDHGAWMRASAAFSVFHTLPHEPTTLLAVGRYEDHVVATPTGLKFAERLAVYDSLLIPNSLVYPL